MKPRNVLSIKINNVWPILSLDFKINISPWQGVFWLLGHCDDILEFCRWDHTMSGILITGVKFHELKCNIYSITEYSVCGVGDFLQLGTILFWRFHASESHTPGCGFCYMLLKRELWIQWSFGCVREGLLWVLSLFLKCYLLCIVGFGRGNVWKASLGYVL